MTTQQSKPTPEMIQLQVTELQLLADQVYRVVLKTLKGYLPAYYAGQYLEVLLPDYGAQAFSIASAPTSQQTELELHIQRIPNKASSDALFDALEQGEVSVRMAKGRCVLTSVSDRPLVFLAAGTGLAQMKSMIEFAMAQPNCPPLHFYWGARTPSGFYMPNLPIYWASEHFNYHPVVSEELDLDSWTGRRGLLFDVVVKDKDILTNSEVFICGSPQMVYATVDNLVANGFEEAVIHSDVFEYAPRK